MRLGFSNLHQPGSIWAGSNASDIKTEKMSEPNNVVFQGCTKRNVGPCLAGLHNGHILSTHHPLHPCTHCNAPTSSSEHEHFEMLFGRGTAAGMEMRDSNARRVALP